ncbi:MAG: hypothetical protein JWQ62_1481, partial [Lacunisphaera sp.]|nr:hypothetical protein [Lacunisphaera sp.]
MKNKIIALSLIAATAFSLAPKPAQASDRGLAVLGGFIGGVLVASELNRDRGYYAPSAPAVVVNDRYDYGYRDDGCWQEVSVRVLVPACWVEERGFYGRNYRRYIGAHYENRTNRVWVANTRHVDRDHRDDRGRQDDRGRSDN